MAKKLEQIDGINEKQLQNQLVTELLAKADPSKIFGRDGLFEQLKKQIVEKVLGWLVSLSMNLGIVGIVRHLNLI